MKKTEILTLRVARRRKNALLKLLKSLDYVEVETLDQKLRRYIKSAPKKVPLTEEDIMNEVRAVRYSNGKK